MSRDSVVRVDGLHYLVARKVAGEGVVAGQQGPSGSLVTDSCLSEEQQPPAHHGGQVGKEAG